MARPKRIDLPFSLYHVLSGTNKRDKAFRDSRDENTFLSFVEKYSNIFSLRIHAWCLVPTLFHLLLETTDSPSLSEFMRRLLTAYTMYFNRRHKRNGYLLQGRFKSYIVDKTNYLLDLSRYIHLIPVETKITKDPEKYRGSSLKYYLREDAPPFLYTKEILGGFKGNRVKYAGFVREGLSGETKLPIMKQVYMGEKKFAQRIEETLLSLEKKGSRAYKARKKQDHHLFVNEKEKAEKIIHHVAQFFQITPALLKKGVRAGGDRGKARTIAIVLLREYLPWTCEKITQYMGLKRKKEIGHYTNKVRADKQLQRLLEDIKRQLQMNETHGAH